MYYEISNVVSNHKYTEHERKYRNPFSKTNKDTKMVYLVKDNPEHLFHFYSLGHCLRPHPFKDAKNADVNTIILDFDNLTRGQYDFVKARANGGFKDGMCGDDSAGMKTWRKECEGIVGATPKHWKFKVFYPTSCLCVYDEVYKSFLEAVSFFNPLRTMDEVVDVWAKWVKARNQSIYFKHDKKKGGIIIHREGDFNPDHPKLTIEDPIFKDWILPDVAMLNSFRTQITFGVAPAQREKIKVLDEVYYITHRRMIVGMGKVPVSNGKDDYEGLDWKVEFDTTNKFKNESLGDDKRKVVKEMLLATIQKMKSPENDDGFLETPLNRSDFAKKVGRNKFDDLVVDESKLISSWWYGGILHLSRHGTYPSPIPFGEASPYAKRIAKTLTHNALEYFYQTNQKDNVFTPLVEMVCRDIIRIFKLRCGKNLFGRCQDKRGKWRDAIDKERLDKFAHAIANGISSSMLKHLHWRFGKKLELAKHPLAESYLKPLRMYRQTHDPRWLGEYQKEREKVLNAHVDEMKFTKATYTRIPRATKRRLLEHFKINHVQAKDVLEFIKVSRRWLKKQDIEVDDDRLVKWFNSHRRSLSLSRHGEKHTSKWSRLLDGKSRDEVSEIIGNLEVSKQMKYKLRKQWVKQDK